MQGHLLLGYSKRVQTCVARSICFSAFFHGGLKKLVSSSLSYLLIASKVITGFSHPNLCAGIFHISYFLWTSPSLLLFDTVFASLVPNGLWSFSCGGKVYYWLSTESWARATKVLHLAREQASPFFTPFLYQTAACPRKMPSMDSSQSSQGILGKNNKLMRFPILFILIFQTALNWAEGADTTYTGFPYYLYYTEAWVSPRWLSSGKARGWVHTLDI